MQISAEILACPHGTVVADVRAMHSTALDFTSSSSGVPPAWPGTPLDDRNQMIRDGLPLVKDIAEKLRRRYVLSMPFEDLCAFGVTGLLTASGRFDASRGSSFCTFAYYRIRGAILDGLRRSDRQYGVLHRRLAAEGHDGRDLDIEPTPASPEKTRPEGRASTSPQSWRRLRALRWPGARDQMMLISRRQSPMRQPTAGGLPNM